MLFAYVDTSFFQPLSDSVNLPVDQVAIERMWHCSYSRAFHFFHPPILLLLLQVRYIALLILSYPLAFILRHGLHPGHTSSAVRHGFSLTVGVAMGLLCFQWWDCNIRMCYSSCILTLNLLHYECCQADVINSWCYCSQLCHFALHTSWRCAEVS